MRLSGEIRLGSHALFHFLSRWLKMIELTERMSELKIYLVMNRRTGKVVSGTDKRYSPPHQIYASEFRPPKLFAADEFLETELNSRGISFDKFDLVVIDLPLEIDPYSSAMCIIRPCRKSK